MDLSHFSYALTPILTWLSVGPIKFLVNSAKEKRWAFDLIGNGGFPSNHSAVVTSMATMIALKEGIAHPAFGVAVTLAFIVIIDANSLRQHVGKHAQAINLLRQFESSSVKLRERMGHTKIEIAGGILTGIAIASLIHAVFNML
ncbi:MAG: divergent PAP2 family protein [Undibacterium sp.]|nr:divergent PAP2 family protein [Undibacterium sp.]